MAWGMGSFRGTKSSSPEASHPLVLSGGTAQHHRQEDELSRAPAGRVSVVMLIGSIFVGKGKQPRGNCAFSLPRGRLPFLASATPTGHHH